MAGRTEFSQEKFEQAILYIATRLPAEAGLGRVKLAKLLMHSDFTAFARLGRSITGATYQKWEHGHLPAELIRVEKDMLAAGRLKQEETDYYGKLLKHTTAVDTPNMEGFEEDELAIIEGSLKQFGHESAAYLSWLSHQELGWQLSKEHDEIPYETFLIGSARPPESVFEELRTLHGLS